MQQQKAIMAILFADIAQSTKLYEKLGNEAAQRLMAICLGALSRVCARFDGTVIKTIGDEIMCTFPTAEKGVDAARKMQFALEDIPLEDLPGGQVPNLYVGLHYGPVIMDAGDVFGDAVNVAARMVGIAKQRQVITTQETINALPPSYVDCVRCIDRMTVKGKSGELLIYEVLCEKDTVTVMLKSLPNLDAEESLRLELVCLGEFYVVSDLNPVVTMGRQTQNDVVINDKRVSRFHARIEYRKGKFILIDQSTNGTHVVEHGKELEVLRRDELQLDRSGVIDLCNEAPPTPPNAVHYTIKR